MQQFAGAGDGLARQLGRRAPPAGRPRRRRARVLRRAGTHRPVPSRTPRSPRPSGFRRRPIRPSRWRATARRAMRALRGADAVCRHRDRDAAADRGRRVRHGAHHAAAADRIRARRWCVPAMIETTSVDGPTNGFNAAPASRNDLRLHRDHQRVDLADVLGGRIEANALGGERADLGGRMRLDHHHAFGSRAPAPASRSASRRPFFPRRRARWCRGRF